MPDSWMDRQKDKVGYEINFNRYFYQYTPLRSLKEIADEILALERKSEGLLNEVLGFISGINYDYRTQGTKFQIMARY